MSKGLGPYWYDFVLLSKAVLADWPQRSKLPSREPSVERAAWQDTAESLGTRGPSHKELISANTHVGLAGRTPSSRKEQNLDAQGALSQLSWRSWPGPGR